MQYSPPPLFKQGASARAKVAIFALIAIVLLVVDARMRTLTLIRQVVGTVLYPVQMVALMPRDALYSVSDYFTSVSTLEKENEKLKQQRIVNAQKLQQAQQLTAENTQLRKLLGASEQVPVKSLMAEILYDARDAFTRKIIINRGSQQGVMPGQPVIDDVGVVGQVTRVFPLTSEVTLLTDKDQAIPVQVVRTGLRSVAYGRGQSGVLDLRFMPANADIQKDDILITSGIDGVYPAGLSVAKVIQVENKSTDAFARIMCQPLAGIDRNRQLLVLLVDMNILPRPDDEVKATKDKGAGKKRVTDGGKDAATSKEADKDTVKKGTAVAPKGATKEEQKPEAKPGQTPEVKQDQKPAAKQAAPVAKVGAATGTANNAPKTLKEVPKKLDSPAKPAVNPTENPAANEAANATVNRVPAKVTNLAVNPTPAKVLAP
jgi:rod shape-determining protein MreC